MLAEGAADRLRFQQVIVFGAGAMGVDVVDVFRRETGIGEAGGASPQTGPSTVGATMSVASPDMPAPASSARIGAPRATACS